MNGPNCLIVPQELIKEIRDSIPEAKSFTDEDLKAKIGALQTSEGELPSLATIKSSFMKKQDNSDIDMSVLDEVANLTFRNAQRKADRVNLIARLFSQVATKMYEKAKVENPSLKRTTFVANNTKAIFDILKEKILNPELIKTEIDTSTAEGQAQKELALYRKEEFPKIQKNWEILVNEAANILYTTEGISIEVNRPVSYAEGDEFGTNGDENNPDGENSASLKDGWMYKARELDLRDALSAETRKILGSLRMVKRDGTVDSDDLGFARYLNPDQAHLTLLEKVSTINSSDEFIPALEELATRHPWVNQVLQAITDDNNSSEFSTIGPKLYNDLRKELLPYYVQVKNADGKLVTKQVNRTPSIFYLLDKWRMMFEQGTVLSDCSIYNKKGEYSKENAEKGKKVVSDILSSLNRASSADEIERVVNSSIPSISKLLNMVGIDFTDEEIIDTIKAGNSIEGTEKKLLSSLSTIFDQVSKKNYKPGTDLINEFSSAFSEIATLFNVVPNGAVIATFREAGRTRQSYSAPSYLGRMLNGLKNSDERTVQQYIRDNFGRFRQFKDENGWENYWLELLSSDRKYRSLLERKVVIHREGKEFDDWTEGDYTNVAMTEFFESPSIPGIDSAYYPLPLLADAPSAEFIRFTKFTDNDPDYILPDGSGFMSAKDIILEKLTDVALWEWDRIELVKSRDEVRKDPNLLKEGESIVEPITSFDGKAGSRFNFFPFLNDSTLDIKEQLSGKSRTEQRIILRDLIQAGEETSFEEFYNSPNSEESKKKYSREQFEDFFYNNAFAYTQMVQMLTTDLAYYKDLNDFQKRFKEVYAMTNRLYTSIPGISKTRRVVNLTDIEFVSPLLKDVKDVLESAVSKGNITKPQMEYILSQWTTNNINVTDAQGFVTLDAYKKVMRMTGNWTQEMENAKQRLESSNGNFEFKDFDIIWQTIKPFMFTFTTVRGGALVQDSNGNQFPYGDLKVPVQYKNSEFLLLALYNSIARSQSKSPMLKALNNWAIKNDIDLVQFDSGVKTGGQASIDLNKAVEENWDRESIEKYLDKAIKNPDTVHLSSWEDYGIQSATPEHLVDHEALIGSQSKKLIFADINDNMEIYLQNHKFNKQGAYQLFQALMSAGYVEGFEKCVDIFSSIENIAKAIQKEMEGNTRYTDEERKACTLNENGEFQIPLYDPIQSTRIQQLLNSIIKKAVTKQETSGAACIQVSNFGLTEELNVRFKDANGNLLPTAKEWLRQNEGKGMEDYISYRDNLRESGAASIAYFECYLPAYSRKFFSTLKRTDGNFNINSLPEELRKCFGYRIPTESKYSMQPIYIKGFLPQQNGSAIMLPAEITRIVGSDFDIDKVYLMLPSFKVRSKSEDSAFKVYKDFNEISATSPTQLRGKEREDFKKWLKEQRAVGRWEKEKGDSYFEKDSFNILDYVTLDNAGNIVKFDYSRFYREVSKEARDNAILDIFWEVLTNSEVPQQIVKPGGFEEASRNAAIMTLLTTTKPEDIINGVNKSKENIHCSSLMEAINILYNNKKLSLKDVKNLVENLKKPLNPLSFSTQTYFHSQNSNGGKMIGVYAVGNASHSIGEWGTTQLKQPMNFLGLPLTIIDRERDFSGGLISENLANFLAASVDNVKDPVLKALNQDTTTGDVTNFLLRAGVPLPYVAAFMVAPKNYNLGKLSKDEKNAMSVNSYKDLSLDDILWYLTSSPEEGGETYSQIYNSLSLLYDDVKRKARDLTQITQAFRGDAMSSAAGPSIGHNIIRTLKIEALRDRLENDDKFAFTTNLLDVNSLIDGSYDVVTILEDSMNQKVPFVYAATKCGVTGANDLLKNVFPQLNPVLLELVTSKTNGLSRYVDLTRMSSDDVAKLIDTFYSEFFLYLLSGTNYFGSHNGSSMKENAKYYLTEFPKKLLEMKAKYPEVFNTNSLTKNLFVSNKGSIPRILFSNSGNLTKGLKGTISNDWAMLLASDNPEIRDFGFELFKYATFSGLEFSGASSFIQLAPNILRRAIKDYNKTIRNVSTNPSGLGQFVWQFVHNHLEESVLSKEIKSSSIHFTGEGEFKKTFFSPDYPAIYSVKDTESEDTFKYEVDSVSEIGIDSRNPKFEVTYKLTSRLGIPNRFKEYYFGEVQPSTIVDTSTVDNTPQFTYDPQYQYTEEDEEFDMSGYESPTVPTVQAYDEKGNQTTVCFS